MMDYQRFLSKIWRILAWGALLLLVFTIDHHDSLVVKINEKPVTKYQEQPNSWFYRQRAFPNGVHKEVLMTAILEKKKAIDHRVQWRETSNFTWNFVGPVNIGGRITDLEMYPDDLQTIFAGSASGGVFRSEDQGKTWAPISDDLPSLAIGDLDIGSDRSIVVGTGEANAGGGSIAYDGYGVYRSKDGGLTWTNIGLNDVGSIGRVVIHPKDPNVIYVAAMGTLFAPNTRRGIFRTKNGGRSWEHVLYVNEYTGGIDLVISDQNPEVLFAAMWQRERTPTLRNYGGPHSNLYKSTDGGENWQIQTNGLPTRGEEKGRIGIAIAPSNNEVVYAFYANQQGNIQGIYRTQNNGDQWVEMSHTGIDDVPYMWWFGRIFVHPANPDKVYLAGLNMHYSSNGGQSWSRIFRNAHVDQHALVAHPLDPDLVIAGNDGGVYVSQDNGFTHDKSPGLPITQFYTCAYDPNDGDRFFGGTQDNGVVRTTTGMPDGWSKIYGGDGFRVIVPSSQPNIVITESQYGRVGISFNSGSTFQPATRGIDPADRRNWNTPIILSDQQQLYLGTNRLYQSEVGAILWQPISPDLTDGPGQNLVFGTITTIGPSAADEKLLFVGTDDGHVWFTPDGGEQWNDISDGLPKRWMTAVVPDHQHKNIAYVTCSGFRYGSDLSHVFRTTDQGLTWEDISFNLPDVPVNDLVVSDQLGTVFIATDIGVFEATIDQWEWQPMGGLPEVVITDLDLDVPNNRLIVATYGRGMYWLGLDSVSSATGRSEGATIIKVYPNPASTFVRIKNDGVLQQWTGARMVNVAGQVVKYWDMGSQVKGAQPIQLDWSTAQLEAGVYWLVLENSSGGFFQPQKLIVQ